MSLSIPVSYGELLDKLTILRIKTERITDADKLVNVRHELAELEACWQQAAAKLDAGVDEQITELKSINEKLWDIEDAIRDREKARLYDEEFIRLARSVYITNDRRAEVKKRINMKLGSDLVEEKSYSDYSADD